MATTCANTRLVSSASEHRRIEDCLFMQELHDHVCLPLRPRCTDSLLTLAQLCHLRRERQYRARRPPHERCLVLPHHWISLRGHHDPTLLATLTTFTHPSSPSRAFLRQQ